MKLHDQDLLFGCDITPPNVRSKIVQPSKPATFADLAREFQTPSP
ncbi:uncharacterized protein [Rutidosis leptorrhynchoides]